MKKRIDPKYFLMGSLVLLTVYSFFIKELVFVYVLGLISGFWLCYEVYKYIVPSEPPILSK